MLDRGTADATVELPGGIGSIAYDARYKKFQATCRCRDHGYSCKLSRTSQPSRAIVGQGRPIGLMGAWLTVELVEMCSDHEAHISPFALAVLSVEKRRVARRLIMSLPGGPLLCSYERDLADGEPDEPEELD